MRDSLSATKSRRWAAGLGAGAGPCRPNTSRSPVTLLRLGIRRGSMQTLCRAGYSGGSEPDRTELAASHAVEADAIVAYAVDGKALGDPAVHLDPRPGLPPRLVATVAASSTPPTP